MKALARKLLRDLRHLSGQIATIALVVASGIAGYVATGGTYAAIERARDDFYRISDFADVFAHLERAPEALALQLSALPGVATVETRISHPVTLPVPWANQPLSGVVLSLPDQGTGAMNRVFVRRGRLPNPARDDEALIAESFASANRLELGATLPVVLNGKQREVTIVGTGLSPEYVFPLPLGGMAADEAGFAILWLPRSMLAPVFQLEGAFNDVSLRLQHGASEPAVVAGVDAVLARHGSRGAITRATQPSNRLLEGELRQLRVLVTVTPLIFLAVAAFLLNVVLHRVLATQRPEIATLKALGYRDVEIALHYFQLVSLIVALGAAIGLGVGAWFGAELTALYAKYFRFPRFAFEVQPNLAAGAVLVSFAAAAAGAWSSLRAVMRLPPAEAMQPPAPTIYRRTPLEYLGLQHLFGPAGRIVIRELGRRPLRALLSICAIAFATGIVVVGRFAEDTINAFMDLHFGRSQLEDVSVTLAGPTSPRALTELGNLPGVWRVEGVRYVPVRFRSGHRHRTAAIVGYPSGTTLRLLVEWPARTVAVPEGGVLLTRTLGEILELRVGDTVGVEVLEGAPRSRDLVVAGFVDEVAGLQGHMALEALAATLGEPPLVSMALLRTDPAQQHSLERELRNYPRVIGVTSRSAVLERFRKQMAENQSLTATVLTLFATAICVGVVYNNSRVALSMRSRELASLRVLGFTRAEISAVLLGELVVHVLAALPLGLVLGRQMAESLMSSAEVELFRFPTYVSTRTFAMAALAVLGAAALSALFVRRRLDRLDLVGVLKTRE